VSEPSDHFLDDAPPAPALSEGLPPGFRMRHDAHRLQRLFTSERAAGLNGLNRHPPAGASDGARALEPAAARDLLRHLGALASCLHLLAESGRSLREQVVTDLARTELQRATSFVQGLQVLGEDPVLTRRSLRVIELIEQALAAVAPELRLAGVEASLDVTAVDVVVAGDARWLGAALGGMAAAMLAVMQTYTVRGAQLRVGGTAAPAAVSIEMAQEVVTFPATLLARFFDVEWADRPGGQVAAVPLVAARRICELHGGRLDVSAGARGGCRFTLTLPRAH
jgi:C4-dicarboxylate-specific signal transduction histidine kinase